MSVRVGVAPLGETDLDPVGVVVDAKRDETEALVPRNGRLDTEDARDWESSPLTLGSLRGDAMVEAGGSIGEA